MKHTLVLLSSAAAAILSATPIVNPDPYKPVFGDFKLNAPSCWLSQTQRKAPTMGWQHLVEGFKDGKAGKELIEPGKVSAAKQTLNGRTSYVSEFFGGNKGETYGIGSATFGDGKPGEADSWMKISAGTYNLVVGGVQTPDAPATTGYLPRGTIYTEIDSDASVQNLVGVGHWCGSIVKDQKDSFFIGDSLLSVSGQVKAGIIGGLTNGCKWTTRVEGNTSVLIKSAQKFSDSGLAQGRIIGGSTTTAGANGSSGIEHKGNTDVTVSIAEDSKKAPVTFAHGIAGGSYGSGKANFGIDGNTSVTISAPDYVTFIGNICGASIANSIKNDEDADGNALTENGASVTGTSTITINGGTFDCGIIAGGIGKTSNVKGLSKIRLLGGTFEKNSYLRVSDVGATVSGGSELSIEAPIDLSAAAGVLQFDTLALAKNSSLNLGLHRLVKTELKITEQASLSITLSAEELAAGSATLFAKLAKGTELSMLTFTVNGAEKDDEWVISAAGGEPVTVALKAKVHTWTSTEGTDWSAGLPKFENGDSAEFGTNTATATVCLDKPYSATAVTVKGDYRFTLTTSGGFPSVSDRTLKTEKLDIASKGRLEIAAPVIDDITKYRYLKFQILERPTRYGDSNNFVGLAEIDLMQNGSPVDWPVGTSVKDAGGDTSYPATRVIDGNRDSSSYWRSKFQIDLSKTECFLQFDAGEGKKFAFNGYRLTMPANNGQHPKKWTLSGSTDGKVWELIDTQALGNEEATLLPKTVTLPQVTDITADNVTVASGATLAGNGILIGKVAFAEDAVLEIPSDGSCLTVIGSVSAKTPIKVKLPKTAANPETVYLLKTETPGLTFDYGTDGMLFHKDGIYMICYPGSATVTGNAKWTELKITRPNGAIVDWATWIAESKVPGLLSVAVSGNASLSADVPVRLTTLTLTGNTSGFAFDGKPVTVETLNIVGNIYVPKSTLRADTVKFADGAKLTWVNDISEQMPKLIGKGTYIKLGNGRLNVQAANEPDENIALEVHAGTLILSDSFRSFYNFAHSVTVEPGAAFRIGSVGRKNVQFGSPASLVTLKGGSRLELYNGASKENAANGILPMTVRIIDATEKPAVIAGGVGDIYTNLTGSIVGEAVAKPQLLTFASTNDDTCKWTVSGNISGNLALIVATPNIVFASEGVYTVSGGTTFACNYLLENPSCFADSDITVNADTVLSLPEDPSAAKPEPSKPGMSGGMPPGMGGMGGKPVEKVCLPLLIGEGKTLISEGTIASGVKFGANATLFADNGDFIPFGGMTCDGLLTIITTEPLVRYGLLLSNKVKEIPTNVSIVDAKGKVLNATLALDEKVGALRLKDTTVKPDPEQPTEGPEIILPDASRPTIDSAVAKAVSAALKTLSEEEAKAIKKVTVASELVSSDIESALSVFAGITSVTAKGDTATMNVAYSFGITAIAVNTAKQEITFIVTLLNGEGKPAALAEGAKLRLYKGETIEGTPLSAMPEGKASFTVKMEDKASLFKVEAYTEDAKPEPVAVPPL